MMDMSVAAQKKRVKRAVAILPVETKRIFWRAMTEDHKNVGEARAIAGIDDIMVAAELVIQCHSRLYIPMKPEDIK